MIPARILVILMILLRILMALGGILNYLIDFGLDVCDPCKDSCDSGDFALGLNGFERDSYDFDGSCIGFL